VLGGCTGLAVRAMPKRISRHLAGKSTAIGHDILDFYERELVTLGKTVGAIKTRTGLVVRAVLGVRMPVI